MLTETFLRDAPLYKPENQKKPTEIVEFARTRPKLHCEPCGVEQTFILQSVNRQSVERRPGVEYHPSAADFVHHREPYALRFTCAACGRFTFHVTVLFLAGPDTVQKIGQFPAPTIRLPETLNKALGRTEDRQLFIRGRISESQGYGIGAYAYYRRLVESVIDELLRHLGELVMEADRDRYARVLEALKNERVTERKIEAVKELLPNDLRPNGVNPLGLLHTHLSANMHTATDEECLEAAAHVRTALVFLLEEVRGRQARKQEFTDATRELLDKSAKKTAQRKGNQIADSPGKD